MTKKLTIASIALIVINVLLMTWIFVHRPGSERHQLHKKRHDSLERRLSKKLNFNEAQQVRYGDLARRHQKVRSEIEIELRNVRKDLHQALFDNNDAEVNLHLSRMDQLHASRERELTAHTSAIFDICDTHQKMKFLKLLNSRKKGVRSKR